MVHDAYVICGTPRTGSTLLCGLLAATGRAGDPDSYFGGRFILWWADQWGLPRAETLSPADYASLYLDAAMRAGRGGTPVFGLRLMRENLPEAMDFIGRRHPGLPSDRARFEAAFGRTAFVHLSRADKLAQAVSLVKAEQTGLWHVAPDGSELERLAPPQEPVYDFERLRREVADLDAYDRAWNDWFTAEAIDPLRVDYDALAADPAGVLTAVCEAIGIEPPDPAEVEPGVARLADALSADWMARYREDGRSRG